MPSKAPLLLALALLLAPGPRSQAQPPESKPDAPPARKPRDPSRQVPPYFGQIGLTPEQRESIYEVRAKHLAKLTELEAEIARIKAAMMTDCESVLTPTQKDLLTQRRTLNNQRRQATQAKPEPPKAEASAVNSRP